MVVEEGDGGAMAAVLLYRPETLTVELRLPAHLHLPEIKRFSPVLLRPVKVPLRDSGEGKSGTRAILTEWCMLKIVKTTNSYHPGVVCSPKGTDLLSSNPSRQPSRVKELHFVKV